MKTKLKFKLKRNLTCLAIGILASVFSAPIQSQIVRDHRTNKKAFVKSQIFHFDEADAIFGKRTEIKKAYPTFKYTGKVNTINITQELKEGDNSIYKMKSGHTLYATVKKGKIIGFGGVNDGSSNTLLFSEIDNNKTCFTCTDLCLYPADGGPQDCWTTCEVVDCTKDYNAQIQGLLAPITKSTPSPGGPIPIPYPIISKLDTINPF